MGKSTWLGLEPLELVIATFFVAMTIIGLTKTLMADGINPLTTQIAGFLLIGIMVTKFLFKVWTARQASRA